MKLSVVIPAYNEENRIGNSLIEITKFIDEHKLFAEIIVVNDGSKDKTADVINDVARVNNNIKLINWPKNSGKAVALKTGILASTGDTVLITDADLSTPINEFIKLKSLYDLGAEVVYASRGKKDSHLLKRQNILRELFGGRLAGLVLKLLLVWGVTDTQCGFKLISGEIARKLFKQLSTTNSALWDMEILILATKNTNSIAECPVTWIHNADTRLPYTFKYIVNTIKGALVLKWRYKLLLPVKVVAKY